ncbi:hypothetical protein [Amycolatopsis magusensis]|uniref:hypothetical protein n=1 Tax=Amycolatopsis magusensis TaxID=882444 RepID=UPI0037A715C7
MAGQSNGQPSTGTHRTNREFAAQLTAWNFAQRKVDGVHLVFRGPHGGTLRVLRSLLGRADAPLVEKAARLAGVTVDRFWVGPEGPAPQSRPADASADAAQSRRAADRDRVTSLVLGVHAEADRPLGFDQVVALAGARVTRDQVRTASAQLCREGDLDRIRSGVYQWSAGVRAHSQSAPPATPFTPAASPAQQALPIPAKATPASATELFEQLFPSGVHMTAELLADFERWAELTEKLAEHAQAS